MGKCFWKGGGTGRAARGAQPRKVSPEPGPHPSPGPAGAWVTASGSFPCGALVSRLARAVRVAHERLLPWTQDRLLGQLGRAPRGSGPGSWGLGESLRPRERKDGPMRCVGPQSRCEASGIGGGRGGGVEPWACGHWAGRAGGQRRASIPQPRPAPGESSVLAPSLEGALRAGVTGTELGLRQDTSQRPGWCPGRAPRLTLWGERGRRTLSVGSSKAQLKRAPAPEGQTWGHR